MVDGDAAEYTGRGKELLIGFLVALAILVPIYLGYFLIGLEAEHYQAFASIPLIAFFYLFGQFAIYRARRYRLTRTVWRGVRFWMTGSGWIYALRASLWGVLMILTLGLVLPWRAAALERYKMRHSHYGDLQGSFEGRGWEFFKRGWWLWLLTPIASMCFRSPPSFTPATRPSNGAGGCPASGSAACGWNRRCRKSALIGLYWKVIGWMVLLGLVFAVYLGLCAVLVASMSGEGLTEFFKTPELMRSIPLLVLAGLGYLVLALAMNVVIRVYLTRDLWVTVLGSVNISGIEAAANVAARATWPTRLAKGLPTVSMSADSDDHG